MTPSVVRHGAPVPSTPIDVGTGYTGPNPSLGEGMPVELAGAGPSPDINPVERVPKTSTLSSMASMLRASPMSGGTGA